MQLGPRWSKSQDKKRERKQIERKARRTKIKLWERARKKRRLEILRAQVVPRLEEILKAKDSSSQGDPGLTAQGVNNPQKYGQKPGGKKALARKKRSTKKDRKRHPPTQHSSKPRGDLLFHAYRGGGFETNRRRH